MSSEDWLVETRTSYDTVADSYAEIVRDLLEQTPYERAMLDAFVREVGGRGLIGDVGCGSGRIAGYLRRAAGDVLGIDLSPAMIEVARREHPGVRFEVGSMTELDLADESLAGLVAWYSLIHIPDHQLGLVLEQFRRVLRPGCPLLIGFHVGDETRLKTSGYGGHPMNLHVHLRQPARMAAWLGDAGFTVEAQLTLSSAESKLGGVLVAR
ncbi:class I SAM-dependent methyltransferase [Kribbella monticola]|uniref:class I SAM-dependent methyltransferase n=1 Tax=Kribbella monticola TaxID=2185285 RepID=UPI000DD361FC|nr:class I SAM-dependent methyltransferase [Kribbella monticola]